MQALKMFVLDTSVLLYDKESITSFPNSKVIIPLSVLDKLSNFKSNAGILGDSARYIIRYLDSLRTQGKLNQGIYIREIKQFIQIEIGEKRVESMLDTVLRLIKKYPKNKLTLITKDLSLRIKCDALGLFVEDYIKDHISSKSEYCGWTELNFSAEQVNQFYKNGNLKIDQLKLYPNQFLVGKELTGKTLLGKYSKNLIRPLNYKINRLMHVQPRNKEQKFAIEALLDPKIPLVTITGLAGSGKTFLSLMAGLDGLEQKLYNRIVLTRSLETVGKEMGYLPGSIQEKMSPWIMPIVDNLRQAFQDNAKFDKMIAKGEIEIAPLAFIRGRTFASCFLMVDEAQNTTIHELKTIITRIGQGSKIILLGDIGQIDTHYIDKDSNGLSVVVEKFKNSPLHAHIQLAKGHRSQLATEASLTL